MHVPARITSPRAPPRQPATATVSRNQLWSRLTPEARERALKTLSRIVAQQLEAPPPAGKEVDDEWA